MQFCVGSMNYEKGIFYSLERFGDDAEYDSRHFTDESSSLSGNYLFFLRFLAV